MKHKAIRWIALCLTLLLPLTGCQNSVIEKVGVLPDRPTQLVAHNTESPETPEAGKSWSVQSADELRLYTSEMNITEAPSSYYFNNTPYLYRVISNSDGSTTYHFEQIGDDGQLIPLHTISVPEGSYFHYAPDGTTAAYETWINDCLTLILVDLTTHEERILWQSDPASLLQDLQISARLAVQWAPDGSSLLFMPYCFANASAPIETADESSVSTEEESAAPELPPLSNKEKMQRIYHSLSYFPILYTYERDSKQLQSFLIAAEDYPLYDSDTQPLICAAPDGKRFFVYFNSPEDPSLAHYLDLTVPLHYSTPLTDYVPSFTELNSRPQFYDQLLYLPVDGVGITALDPVQGTVVAQYSFYDPIHAFTLYEDTLIVAQSSPAGGGVDVTAYLLNLDTKQSVLLYHNSETYSPYINHMEISQDGLHLMIEQLPSTYRTQKQLIQLSFK